MKLEKLEHSRRLYEVGTFSATVLVVVNAGSTSTTIGVVVARTVVGFVDAKQAYLAIP